MKFAKSLTYFRERCKLNKKELADALGVTPEYIGNIEKGHKKPPTADRCAEIAKVLKLSVEEKRAFFLAAKDERSEPEELSWAQHQINEPAAQYSRSSIPPKIADLLEDPGVRAALLDPVAIKALLWAHEGTKESRAALESLLEKMPKLEAEKLRAIVALAS